jgi:hypothetical protein
VPCGVCEGLGYNEKTLELYRTFDSWASKVTKAEAAVLVKCKFSEKEVAGLRSGKMTSKNAPILRMALVEIRATRKKLWGPCENCNGTGDVPNPNPAVMTLYEGINLYETWEPIDPPIGEGWQFWDEDGVPLSPVFENAEKLAKWCADAFVGHSDLNEDGWLQWVLSVRESPMKRKEHRPFRLQSDGFQVYLENEDGSH